MSPAVPGPDLPGMRYVEKIGSGGFSDVYLYEQEHPRLKVAVKLLRSDVLDDDQRRQLAAEADVMAELAEHPFIVPVLGAGTAPDGRPYLVMRYFPPPDLGARVAQTRMSVPDALRTGIQLASAVETAHRAGIIHRDIKPQNILVSSYGVPALSDFGIAGRGDGADGAGDEEHLGVSMPWSPPEVLTGRSNGSAASDVYSLGATIWHLLVGRSPFALAGANSERAMFARILHTKPAVTGRDDVPGSLDRLLQQAMAKDAAHRPRTALELARHLQRIEQELRLARTEIVVLETDAPDSPGTRDVTRSTAAPEPDDGDRDDDLTMRKRPTTVSPVASTSAAEAFSATVRRPAVASVSPSTSPSTAADAASGDRTTRRPARIGPAATEPPVASEPDGHPRGPGRLAIAGVVAVVCAAVIGVAVVLTQTGGNEPPEATPSAPGPTSASEVIDDLAPDGNPTLTAKSGSDGVTFSATGAARGSAFAWQSRDASGTYQSVNVPASTSSVTVKPDGAGTACVRLYVSLSGQLSGPYDKCADGQ